MTTTHQKAMNQPAERTSRSTSRSALLIAAILAAAVFPVSVRADFDRWFTVSIQNQHAGWMHESQTTDEKTGEIITTHEMQVSISRGSETLNLQMKGRLTESSDGKPLKLWTRENLGSNPRESTYRFESDHITLTNPKSSESESLPLPAEPFLTPSRLQKAMTDQLKNQNDSFDLTMLDPLSGIKPVTLKYTVLKRNTPIRNASGKTVNATRWIVRQDGQNNLASTEWVDDNGILIQGRTTFGSFDLTLNRTDRGSAQRPSEAPELLTTTFIKPDQPIRNPRATKTAAFELTLTSGAFPELPATGSQTVLTPPIDPNAPPSDISKPSTRRIRVDIAQHAPATDSEIANKEDFLAASPYINSDSTAIADLVRRADKRKRTTLNAPADAQEMKRRAEAMRSFVYRYVRQKDLGVGFASAKEVARTRNGDCTEHAVLLAAMLRADHIPTRIASGLIYAESFVGKRNIFGYHMWTQALIDNQWIDLDATLPRPFDATHITLQTSALKGDSPSDAFSEVITLFGHLRIKIINTSY